MTRWSAWAFGRGYAPVFSNGGAVLPHRRRVSTPPKLAQIVWVEKSQWLGNCHFDVISAILTPPRADAHCRHQRAIGEAGGTEVKQVGPDLEQRAVVANVRHNVKRLEQATPILAEMVAKKKLRVVGAVYDLPTGKVALV